MKHTIKSSKEIGAMIKTARRVSTTSIIAYISEPPDAAYGPKTGRAAFIGGKRLGAAPVRNRAKRRLREAMREAGLEKMGCDAVFVATKATNSCDFERVVADARQVAAKIEGRRAKTL
jgi:ribonuclease P protein component